jgi:deoxyribodipyrimidine photolyase-related protein
MALQVKNLTRLSDAQRQAIRERAAVIRRGAVA